MLHVLRTLSSRSAAPRPKLLSQAVAGAFSGRSMPAISGALLLALQSGLAIAQTAPAASDSSVDKVIVTGTRTSGLKAIDSASPIQVLDAGSLERTGQPDLIQAIAQNIPSFTAQAVGGDTANMTLSARLRGLSPNDTLVLVNGKRRHTTANLAVLGGPYQGGAAADLNFIPVSAIDHIEVLQDGAAAQYGSDAIAGVVNIILKKEALGGSLTTSGGGYYDGGGRTGDASFNYGFDVGEQGYLNLSAEDKFHGHSDRGGDDPRTGSHVNSISGDAEYHLKLLSLNGGMKLNSDTEFYSNATYGKKSAEAYENYRMPTRLPAIYPHGFSPLETIDETDIGATVGIKGRLGEWNWDLSTTWGQDTDKIGVINSGNVSLYNDTGYTPTTFHAGNFIASQATYNFDINREVNVGWKTPLTMAFGLERRRDTYEIDAGDAASRYKEGSQSYPGFSLTDAGSYSRNNSAVYADFSGSPIDKLKLDAAARFEHFSDFGSARVGKLTGRYDFTPEVGVRSTVSNGFRAPTLAEEYYSATNVSPTSAFVQLAPNSIGAKLLGIDGLRPEKSKNYSVGLVLHPAPGMSLSFDAYQIKITDRIVGSGAIYGSGSAIVSAAVIAAIKANGNVLDSSVAQTGVNIFSNAADTRTRGLEAVFTYGTKYDGMGRVDWSAAASYNSTKVTKINDTPSQIYPQLLLDKTAISDLETASPKFRLNLGALWKQGPWAVNLRESIYGPAAEWGSEDGVTYYETKISTKAITDLDISYQLTKSVSLSIGANNLFNQYPNKVSAGLLAAERAAMDNAAVTVYPSFSPIGINGGYYYAKMNYTF